MTNKLNLMKLALIGIFTLLMITFTNDATAAIQSKTLETIETKKENLTIKNTVKRYFESAKKFTSKKVRQLKKQYNEMSSIRKVGWGIGMIIVGTLVVLGSVLTLSGWWFVIGLGLMIFGALKIVLGVLGVVIS
ncbi:MAG: hypothetical protein AB8G11_13440 [Saprospiraceae bacterium]